MSADTQTLTVRCSACQSVFRVQPSHLNAAQGWMQCGVCGHVFHADLPAPPAPEMPAPEAIPAPPPAPLAADAAAPATSVPAPEAESIAAEASVATTAEATSSPAEAVAEVDAGSSGPATLAGLAQRMAEPDATMPVGPKLESIILVDPAIPADDLGPLPSFAPDEPPAAATTAAPVAPKVASATESNWIPRQAPEAPPRQKRRRSGIWLWRLLAVPLLLVLLAQLAYFLRDEIAARYPDMRAPLEEMCDVLDCKLALPRDPKQVLILGSDLQTEGPGNLALAVTLANRSRHAMAWPVLELTLTDVKDQPLGRRVFAPSEYLPTPEAEASGIQPLSEVPLTLKLETTGIKAVGYRLKMFY
jgi:predicted Zn finger-like uncharacterized protein